MNPDIFKLLDEIKKIDLGSMQLADQEDYLKIIFKGVSDKNFEQSITDLLKSLHDGNLNISGFQGELCTLLKNFLRDKHPNKKLSINENLIKQGINEIAQNQLNLSSENHISAKKNLSSENIRKSPNKGESQVNTQAQKDFNKAVKYFATYEIYKALNPRRIAGESKKSNFIHNVIVRGFDKATQYTGGRKNDLAKYSERELEKIKQLDKRFKNKGFER